jgi:hypothetical protein
MNSGLHIVKITVLLLNFAVNMNPDIPVEVSCEVQLSWYYCTCALLYLFCILTLFQVLLCSIQWLISPSPSDWRMQLLSYCVSFGFVVFVC